MHVEKIRNFAYRVGPLGTRSGTYRNAPHGPQAIDIETGRPEVSKLFLKEDCASELAVARYGWVPSYSHASFIWVLQSLPIVTVDFRDLEDELIRAWIQRFPAVRYATPAGHDVIDIVTFQTAAPHLTLYQVVPFGSAASAAA